MVVIECFLQHARLIQSFIILINCVSPLLGFHFTNDDALNLNKSEFCDRNCTRTDECCRFYFCSDGVCRKPGSNIEFIVLAKVSLEITFALLLAAIFIFLLRGFFNIICERYQWFGQQDSRCNNVSSTRLYTGQCPEPRPTFYDVRPDKPPSYEECVRSSPRGAVPDSPPSYSISASLSSNFTGNEHGSLKFDLATNNLVPLDAQALEKALRKISEESMKVKKPPVPEE